MIVNLRFKLALAAFVLADGFAAPAFAGSFEDGLDAARRADYETVLRLWHPGRARWQRPGAALADLYANGVLKDYAAAANRYRKAADQGDVNAQSKLALMYASGHDVPKELASSNGRHWQAVRCGGESSLK
jgi:uncharacterized protein